MTKADKEDLQADINCKLEDMKKIMTEMKTSSDSVVSTALWGVEPVNRQAWADQNMTNPRENFSEKKTAVR